MAAAAYAGSLPPGAVSGAARLLVRPLAASTLIVGTVATQALQAGLVDGSLAVQPWLKGIAPGPLAASVSAVLESKTFHESVRWGTRIAMSRVCAVGGVRSTNARMIVRPAGPVTVIAAQVPGRFVADDQLWLGQAIIEPAARHTVRLDKELDAALTSDTFATGRGPL